MSARSRVADHWDEVIGAWRPGQDTWPGALHAWFTSYAGKREGKVDLDQYPDPWVGDLRGEKSEPRLVVLGLNPGVGYDRLQGVDGTWTERIREVGYSRCLQRSPAEDPETWLPEHGKQSPYWVRLANFAQRWLQDPSADHRQVLNFELYPWHSRKLTAGITSPPAVVKEYVLDPIGEIGVDDVFAFGAAWFEVGAALDLPLVARWGADGDPWPTRLAGWVVEVRRLPSGQRLVVSRQQGYSGPPGQQRLELLRERLDSL